MKLLKADNYQTWFIEEKGKALLVNSF